MRGASRTGSSAGGDVGAGPPAGDRALGGAAAAGAVVDVPDQLAAQGAAQDVAVVAGEAGDSGAGAGLHDGQGGAGAFHLAGGRGEQFAGGGEVHAEDGGDLVRGQVVAHGEFEGLALLGGGAGGLRPGQEGEFGAVALVGLVCRGGGGGGVVVCVVGGCGARAGRGRPAAWLLGRFCLASASLRRQDQRASA
nr:hypothetical protein [Streptomyces sp. RS2]